MHVAGATAVSHVICYELSAAIIAISTRHAGIASFASTVARVGGAAGSIHASQTSQRYPGSYEVRNRNSAIPYMLLCRAANCDENTNADRGGRTERRTVLARDPDDRNAEAAASSLARLRLRTVGGNVRRPSRDGNSGAAQGSSGCRRRRRHARGTLRKERLRMVGG